MTILFHLGYLTGKQRETSTVEEILCSPDEDTIENGSSK